MAKSSTTRTKKSKTGTSVSTAVKATEPVADSDPVNVESPDSVKPDSIKNEADSKSEDLVERSHRDKPQDAIPDVDVPDVDKIGPPESQDSAGNVNLNAETGRDAVQEKTPERDFTTVVPRHEPKKAASGFIPLLMGGIVAGAIGYGVAILFPLWNNAEVEDLSPQIAANSEQIAALEDYIANQPAPDFSAIEDRVSALGDETTTRIDDVADSVTAQLSTFDDRLTELEKQPNTDGTLSETALATYQQELDDLRAELNAQQESVMATVAQAEDDLAAARAEAQALEQQALAAAEASAGRVALNRIATAVETGAPYRDALTDLDDAEVPAALTNAADTGVATTAQLAAEFPAVARAALATAREEGVSDDASGFSGFLRSQFDVRSTAPKEGPGPDAVLSRAQDAVMQGRISDALAEIEDLPEVAQAQMEDWTARATERVTVLDAIATMSETYK